MAHINNLLKKCSYDKNSALKFFFQKNTPIIELYGKAPEKVNFSPIFSLILFCEFVIFLG